MNPEIAYPILFFLGGGALAAAISWKISCALYLKAAETAIKEITKRHQETYKRLITELESLREET